ncbi:MAG: hypothetical protein OHK0037_20490 [Elainellaceae cyanobacterium]
MPNFLQFMDQNLPGERLINLDQIQACSYYPNGTPLLLEINFFSGEFLVLKDWTAVSVWAYLTAAIHCRALMIEGEPQSLELTELDI